MSTARKLAPGSVPGHPQLEASHSSSMRCGQRVEVSDDDRTVATAEVTTSEGSGGTARVSLQAEPGTSPQGAARAWSTLCWIFPRCRKAHAWRPHSGSAMASHCTGFRSAARTSVPARLGGARSLMRTFRPAAPGSTSQTQPARNPCRAHNDCVLAARSVSAPPGNTGRCRPAAMASLISGSCPQVLLTGPRRVCPRHSAGRQPGRLPCRGYPDLSPRPAPRSAGS